MYRYVISFCKVSGTFVADASTLQNLIASGTVQLTDASGQPLQLVRLTSNEEVSVTAHWLKFQMNAEYYNI